ncbi:MAG: hypothetical protein Q9208_007973 [Pyrenodesmia sp. 3 TL-2023]
MDDESETPSEQQSLGSWHPAHMPQSDNLSDSISQPNDDVLVYPPPSRHSSVASDPPSDQPQPSPSDHQEEGESSSKFSDVDPLNDAEFSDRSQLASFQSGFKTQCDENTTGQSGQGSLFPDIETTAKEDNTGVVNGLSFVQGTPPMARYVESPDFGAPRSDQESQISAKTLDAEPEVPSGGKLLQNFDTLERTNSFPTVPPISRAHEIEGKAHSQLHVESIVEEGEEAGDGVQNGFFAGGAPQTDPAGATAGNFFGDSLDDGEDDFLDRPIGVEGRNQSFSPADDEARFEEGLPLVPLESSTTRNEDILNSATAPAWPGDQNQSPSSPPIDSEQDFFRQEVNSPEEASFFKPKALGRKTTSQVLRGINYPAHDAAHDEAALRLDQHPLTDASGGGEPVPSSNVVFANNAERSGSAEHSPAEMGDQKDEDLAAMWQAALDDDDLLDEGELPLDQSTLLAGPVQVIDQPATFSPVVQRTYGADERMSGFYDPKPAYDSKPGAGRGRYSPAADHRNSASSSYPNHMSSAAPQQQVPQHYNLSQSSSVPSGFGANAVLPQPPSNAFTPVRPSMPKQTQSFADKSKGGYTSPYDLPMDVTRPKKRTNMQQVQGTSSNRASPQPPPPPRSTSSIYTRSPSGDGPLPPVPHMPSIPPGMGSSVPSVRPPSSNVEGKPSVGSFFEELPVTKSRPQSSAGRYAPGASPQIPSKFPPRPEPPRQMSVPPRPNPNSSNAATTYQLVPPERHSPYANMPSQETSNAVPSQVNTRYSPAPGLQSHVPVSRNRYAASPGVASRPPQSSQAMPFQPRTSSPLAQNHTAPQQQHRQTSAPSDLPVPSRSPPKGRTMQKTMIPNNYAVTQVEEHFNPSVGRNAPGASAEQGPPDSQLAPMNPHDQCLTDGDTTRSSLSASRPSSFTPKSEENPTMSSLRSQLPVRPPPQALSLTEQPPQGPPRRSQTQSPGAVRFKPDVINRTKDAYHRPVSASGRVSPVRAEPPVSSSYAPFNRIPNSSTQDLNYIRPTDGREHDPLERWKGAPLLKFGFGGVIVTSFPKHIPRYAAGHGFPMIKCNPGEVKLQTSNVGTLDDDLAKFPGPLKTKGKKKDLVEWLQRKVDSLERAQTFVNPSSLLPDPVRRHEEKILLWQTMKVSVEYDGIVAGNSKAEQSVRAILCPDAAKSEGEEPSLPSSGGLSPGISKHDGPHAVPNQVDSSAMEAVRKLLLQGEREKAVWYAVDQRMWAHAMVLSSTLDKSVWKQVLHEFTRLEVKTYGENTESLAAMYEVFAGNWDESIDQLVPPSARAGLQMVSKAASTGPTRNALDGLDRWRETLAMILSNRTQDDEHALIALNSLLSGYGRIEAAHLCLLFTKSAGIFGGSEDAQASVALLGADHQQQPFDYGRDLDSILLTEVYDFVRSVLAPSASLTVSPHLQSYKLYHAILLAEHGYRSEAQQYCDAVMSTLKSTTRPSPYYHSLLFNALDDLMERLQQGPRDASSWMSKPMDKVSGSMWKKLNNFIVGDEGDTASVASGKVDQDTGPFARAVADTPSISRSPSTTDLYGAFGPQGGPLPPAPNALGSRYAPGTQYSPTGQYTPRSSLEQQARPSEEFQRPAQSSTLRPSQPQHPYPSNQPRYTSSPAPQHEPSTQQQKPRYQPSPYISPKPDSYLPTPPSQPEYMPIAPPEDPSTSLSPPETYQRSDSFDSAAPHRHNPNDDLQSSNSYEPVSNYDPIASAYEPPSSYAPYDPQGQDMQSPIEQGSPKKKKSFMDDDDDKDDFVARAAAILKSEKAQKDREADDAFRKAAEADAQKDQSKDLKAKKSGWFGGIGGGWLGGGKKDDGSLSNQEPKAIKAKLGEESSFYYDKDLKKWVNKKGPAPTSTEAPKAPPPRGPPSRAVSGAGGPPSTAMSRGATPPVPPIPSVLTGQTATPPIHVSQPTPLAGPQSGPPSRTETPSRAGSPAIAANGDRAPSEGPPSAPPSRPRTAVTGTSSIDDLIGEPRARQGGTIRRGKKGRGYVDVMAQ